MSYLHGAPKEFIELVRREHGNDPHESWESYLKYRLNDWKRMTAEEKAEVRRSLRYLRRS